MNFIEKCSKNFCTPTKPFHTNKNLLPTRLLISKSKWIPNEACSNCFNCNKTFNLLRRKHHCRMCGNVLCSKCTNYWLNSYDLDLDSEEKYIRVCEYCYGLYLSFLKPKLSKQSGRFSNSDNQGGLLRPDGEHFQGDLEFELSQQSSQKHPQNSLTAELMKPFNLERDLNVEVARKIEEFVKFVTKEQNIFEEWYKVLLIMVKRTINEVRINTLTKSESMDICEYIKIKKIIWENSSESRVIKGFVCRKKLGNRKFLSPIANPKFLVIQNSIDLPSNDEELINCEKKYFKPIMDKIKKLGPSVVIVEKRIHRFAQDLLNEMDIIFYYNFSNKTLQKIARFTGARVIKDLLSNLGNLKSEDILGTCRSFYTRNFKKVNNDSILLTGDPSIMYFDGCFARGGGISLTLSGRESEQLIKVKRSLKTILRLARHFLLEKELVLHDRINMIPRKFQAGENEEVIKFEPPLTHGDFSRFLDDKTSRKRLLQEEPINYSQICLVKGMLENFNDLQDDQQAMSNINKKITENIEKNQGKIDFFAEICSEAKQKKVSPYLENDIAIGHYIILKVDKLFKKCKHCNRPKYHHLALYYSGGSYVKISTELTGLCRALAIREETTDLFVSPIPLEQLKNNDLSSSTILERRIAEIGTNGGSMLINHFRDSPRVKRANSVTSFNNEGFFLRKMSMVSSLNHPNAMTSRIEESESSLTAGKTGIRKSSFHQRLERSERSSIFSFNKPEEEGKSLNNNEKNTFRRYQSLYRLGQLPGKDVIIKTYIECSTCKMSLTEEGELKPAYLEYSFSKFLKHLFLQDFPKEEKQKLDTELSKKSSLANKKGASSIHLFQIRCAHTFKSRVFKYDEILVKISVSTAEFYNLRQPAETDRSGVRRPSRADVKQKVDRLKERTVFLLDNLKAQALFMLKGLKQADNINIYNSEDNSALSDLDVSRDKRIKERTAELESIISNIAKFSEEFDRQHMKLKGLLCLDNMRLTYFKKISEFYEVLRGVESEERKSTKNIRRVKTISKEFHFGSSDRFVVEIRSPRTMKRLKEREKLKKDDNNEESWMGSVSASEDNITIDRRNSLEFIRDLLLNFGHGMLRQEEDNPQFHQYQFYRHVSVSKHEPLQAVAFALNSTIYLQDVYLKEGFYENSKILYSDASQSNLDHQKHFLKFKLYLNELVDPRDHITIKAKFNQDLAEQNTIAGEFEKFTKYLPSNILFKKATNNGLSADEDNRGGFSTGNEELDTKQSLEKLVNEKMPVESLALSCHQWEAQTLKIATEKTKSLTRQDSQASTISNDGKYLKIWARHDVSDSSYMAEENASCDSPLIEQKEEGININSLLNLQKTVKVKLLFPGQFEAVRSMERIYLADFIDSIAQIKPWVENTGGKSKASFVKSRDGLYVFKSIKKREFKMFSQFAHKYFKYLWKSKFLGRPSILSRMLGLYEVLLWGRKHYSVAMENLFLGMEWSEGFKVYDLKGSEINRYIKEGEEMKNVKQVFLDTNFKVDQNGEPLPIKLEDFKYIMEAVENDTKFLSKQNLIDYSLLLIIDSQKHVIRVGIIDYLRTYTWDKKLETVGKKVMKGVTPTVVNPLDYRERFVAAMKRYFMPIPVN